MKAISAAFVKAQKGFSPALKNATNPHFKSRYPDLASCVEAVIDALNANGIALCQKTAPDETGVTVETVFIHESGETMSFGSLHVPASKNDAQGYGSALTYARRYSLMAACGIAPEDDDGNAASKSAPLKILSRPAYETHLSAIDSAQNEHTLKAVFATAYKAAQGASDGPAMNTFKDSYDKRKAALEQELVSQP